MKVLYKWKKCQMMNDMTAYYIEVPKEEITSSLIGFLSSDDKKKYQDSYYQEYINHWAKKNPDLAKPDCIYILASEDGKMVKLSEPEFPYSGLWNAYNPLVKVDFNINSISELISYK